MGTKERIFDEALQLFSERGFDGVSIRDIASAVGIKESSIYNHYRGKKTIMDDICERFVETLSISRPPLQEVEKWLDHMQPVDIFKRFIMSYGKQINPGITQMARIIFAEQFHDETARKIFRDELIEKNVRYYIEVLTMFEGKDRIVHCDKNVVATLFNNSQITLSIQYSQSRSGEDYKKIAGMTCADFLIKPLERKG